MKKINLVIFVPKYSKTMAITRNIRKSTFDTKHAKIIQFTALWHPIGSFICYLHFFASLSQFLFHFVRFSLECYALCIITLFSVVSVLPFILTCFLRCTFIWETLVEEQQMKCDLSMKKKPRNSMKRMRKKIGYLKKKHNLFYMKYFSRKCKVSRHNHERTFTYKKWIDGKRFFSH